MAFALMAMHLAGNVGYNLVLRHELTGAAPDPQRMALLMSIGIAVPAVIAWLVTLPASYSASDLALIGFAVVACTGLHLTNARALVSLSAGTYSIVYNLRIVLATILAVIVLGESPEPRAYAGALLIFAAIFLVSFGRRSARGAGLLWALLAAFSISVLNTAEKELVSDLGFLDYAGPAMLAVVLVLLWVNRRRPLGLSEITRPHLALMGLRALSAYGFLLAFAAGVSLSVATYVSSSTAVITVFAALLFLGEREHLARKLAAAAIAGAGLLLVAGS